MILGLQRDIKRCAVVSTTPLTIGPISYIQSSLPPTAWGAFILFRPWALQLAATPAPSSLSTQSWFEQLNLDSVGSNSQKVYEYIKLYNVQ